MEAPKGVKLGSEEYSLLIDLGKHVGVTNKVPLDILKGLAKAMGIVVDEHAPRSCDGGGTSTMHQEGRETSKKRKVGSLAKSDASISLRPYSATSQDSVEVGEELRNEGDLIPAALMHDDGTLYLEQFEPVTISDDRTASQVKSGPDVVESGDHASLFQWMVSPCSEETFFSSIFEMKPLLIQRPNNSAYYDGWFDMPTLKQLLSEGKLRYGFNLDVTHYNEDSKRRNFNFNSADGTSNAASETADGEHEVADASVVWKRYEDDGCSLRVLHPQRYCDAVWKLLAVLEQRFQCPMGSNVYLTPANSQGFAPHYDDVDVFILQLEGRKRWRVYKPLQDQILPRFSSPDFPPDAIGEPILDVTLSAGDLLYLPRGTIHQANSLPDAHSLHLTVSANQKRTWLDFLEAAMAETLRELELSSLAVRFTTPADYFEYMGVMFSDEAPAGDDEDEAVAGPSAAGGGEEGAARRERAASRQNFRLTVRALMRQLAECVAADETADQLCAELLRQRLPPVGLPQRPAPPAAELPPPSVVFRCPAPNLARIVPEDDDETLTVYHCMNNKRREHAAAKASSEGEDDGHEDADNVDEEEDEDDVLKMPYFLVPKEMVGVVEAFLTSSDGLSVEELVESVGDVDKDDATEVVLTLYNLGIVTHEK